MGAGFHCSITHKKDSEYVLYKAGGVSFVLHPTSNFIVVEPLQWTGEQEFYTFSTLYFKIGNYQSIMWQYQLHLEENRSHLESILEDRDRLARVLKLEAYK